MTQDNQPQSTKDDLEQQVAQKAERADLYEFLPAALEVLDAPPAPFGRIIAVTLAAFFFIAVIWAWIGTVDVVVMAQGQTIPTGKIKVIQPLETGVVRAIHIEEGQTVAKDDLLIELDTTEALANIDAYTVDLVEAKLEAAKSTALLQEEPIEAFLAPKDIDPELGQATFNHLKDEVTQYKSRLKSLDEDVKRSQASIRAAAIEEDKLQQTIPLIEEQLDIQEGLLKKKISQRQTVLALRQELLIQKAALSTARESKEQNKASIESLKAKREEITSSFRAEAHNNKQKALKQIAVLEQSLKKERQRLKYRTLIAPVDGMAHQLNVHTIGAVVNTAEQLMTIVPTDAPLEIEAMILNKDIGFVEPDQETEIKLEAFPFTRYGTIKGKLVSLSDDAIIHEKLGPVFKAKVALDNQYIQIKDKQIPLTPGMNTTVEIKTDQRRIIDFFLSPLLRYKDEAIRER